MLGLLWPATGAATAVGGTATCTAAQKAKRAEALKMFKRTMASKRKAYYRAHRGARARRGFTRRQQAKLQALQRAANCRVPTTSPAPPPPPPPPPAPPPPPPPPPQPPPPPSSKLRDIRPRRGCDRDSATVHQARAGSRRHLLPRGSSSRACAVHRLPGGRSRGNRAAVRAGDRGTDLRRTRAVADDDGQRAVPPDLRLSRQRELGQSPDGSASRSSRTRRSTCSSTS